MNRQCSCNNSYYSNICSTFRNKPYSNKSRYICKRSCKLHAVQNLSLKTGSVLRKVDDVIQRIVSFQLPQFNREFIFYLFFQQQQQLQHEQRQQAAESSLQLNFPPENQPSPTVVSPRSLPTTTHSGSPIGAAEMIWGTEPESPQGKFIYCNYGSSFLGELPSRLSNYCRDS